jgi:hypothetical protein
MDQRGEVVMKKERLSVGIIVLGLSFLLVDCAPKDLEKDFAIFDRAYIPALALTNQGEAEQSKAAMILLIEHWSIFKGKYYGHGSKDSKWKKNFDDVEQAILKADEIVKGDRELLEAHELLESIRFTFMELRKRNGIDYYVDYLTEFHEPMEEIVLTSKGKTPDTLIDTDVEKIQELLPEALHFMNKIETPEFDSSLFDFDNEKTRLMKEYIKLESESLSKLEQAMKAGDKKMIIQSSAKIKPNFVKLFFLFGDFGNMK